MKNFTFQRAFQTLDEKARTLQVVASTETIDRYGDIVRIAGINTDNYMKNPVVLFSHDAEQLPIGKAVVIQKTTGQNPQLLITIQFATAEENPQAEKVFQSYKGGFLNAVSIGFMPKQYEMRLDAHSAACGMDFLEVELLELSCVSVPANPQALAKKLTAADTAALLQALQSKPKNKTIDPDVAKFLTEFFNPAPAGSVSELIRRSAKK